MGGRYKLYLCNTQPSEWKNKYINSWVTGGMPLAGSVKIPLTLFTGTDIREELTTSDIGFDEYFPTKR